MSRLVIVPARGGSKRLPGKNLRPLHGKPLLSHTIDVVRECFDQVLVTSDSTEILALVVPGPNVHTALRPAEFATDHSKVIDTVSYYFDQYAKGRFDQIWLCLPTCPLRTSMDMQSGISLLSDNVDSVVSVTEYEFPPLFALTVKDGLLTGVDPALPLASGNSRSQDQAVVYRPNGAFYGMWRDAFDKYRNFYRGRVAHFFMPRERSIDVDTELDFLTAEVMLTHVPSMTDQERLS